MGQPYARRGLNTKQDDSGRQNLAKTLLKLLEEFVTLKNYITNLLILHFKMEQLNKVDDEDLQRYMHECELTGAESKDAHFRT